MEKFPDASLEFALQNINFKVSSNKYENYDMNSFLKDNDFLENKFFKLFIAANSSKDDKYEHILYSLLIYGVQKYSIPIASISAYLLAQKNNQKAVDDFVEFLKLNQDDDGSIGLINPFNDVEQNEKDIKKWKINNTLFASLII
ncbi:MAG: hypothetical protein LBC17_03370 [Lactobacillaceae bacterium]|jgi:hypothetical protein|nr:hypothetical protein [Lactobacillaceae bacterium]